MHPSLAHKFEYLKSLTDNLLNELGAHDLKILQKKRSPEVWSAIQILNHLILSEAGTLRYLKKKIRGIDGVRMINILDSGKFVLFQIYLLGLFKLKAPRGVDQPGEEGTLEEISTQWKSLRAELVEFLEAYEADDLRKVIFKHPIFGRITLPQTLDFFGYHLRHHQRQLKKRLHKS
ncbi:MAG: DinB family protein [Cyclobacteriaceae bacterium]